ncbi:MAG: hypothetical protein L0H31_02015 [Nocardioidaceae bacterium]|nr:hypothetical protein [Nocardioidaceae bacterium]
MIRLRWRLPLVALALVAATLGVELGDASQEGPASVDPASVDPASVDRASLDRASLDPVAVAEPAPRSDHSPTTRRWRAQRALPRGGTVVAYYGTAGTGALGVLGETSPARAHARLTRAARGFRRPGRPVRLAFELIVTVADGHPGKGGDYSHDIARAEVRRYLRAARTLGALVVLDLQTGRSNFLSVARRWGWALKQPHVGLALDPEWRMGRHQVPGRVIGSVRAREVNRVSDWLSRMVLRRNLPEKLFVLHQFRTTMLPDITRIRDRDGLQLVQHVDGFGTPGQKLDTYRAVARPDRFAMGFKLFYDEDVHRLGPAAVSRIRPRVRFVSFQ